MVMKFSGMDLASVLDMTFLDFNRLLDTVLRIEYSQKIEQAWTSMIAAQGKDKAMRDWTARWEEAIMDKPAIPEGNDFEAFSKAFGGR